MITRSKIKNALIAAAGAVLFASLVQPSPAAAGHGRGWGGGYGPRVVVHRHVVHRPMVRRVVHVHRPVVYHPGPMVRRVVVVHRPFHRGGGYGWHGWHHRVGYGPGRPHWRWHDRPRCLLPERYLCR